MISAAYSGVIGGLQRILHVLTMGKQLSQNCHFLLGAEGEYNHSINKNYKMIIKRNAG